MGRARRNPWFALVVLVSGLAVLPGPAWAHKLKVFAFAEGPEIAGSAYFAGGAAASGARIAIYDGSGRLVGEPVPDREGRFRWRALAPTDHRVVADSGDGHRAEWRISADELAPGFSGGGAVPAAAAAPADRVGGVDAAPAGAGQDSFGSDTHGPEGPRTAAATGDFAAGSRTAPGAALDPVLAAAIEQAVARQVRPLREELIAAQDRAQVRDVLGGIGYILGLTGALLWWQARRGGASRSRARPDREARSSGPGATAGDDDRESVLPAGPGAAPASAGADRFAGPA